MRRLLILFLLSASLAGAQSVPFGLGLKFGLQPIPNPINLPLAHASTPIFTFLGSFKSPIKYGANAMSLDGAGHLYVASNYYDPADSGIYIADGGLAEIAIPPLSGTPAYDGSNGTATTVINTTAAADYISNAVACPVACTVTATPVAGATSATLTTLPAGFAGDANPTSPTGNYDWFVQFHGATHNPDEPITSLSGNTVSWLGGLPADAGYTTNVTVYKWRPHQIFGNASGNRLTGSMVYGGSLYVTGGTYYDSGCNQQAGWVSKVSTDLSTWGTPNTVASNATQILGGASLTQYSRRYAAPLAQVPSVWKTLLGGAPAYIAGGQSLSVLGCDVPIGFSFTTFDPATVSSTANAVTVTPYLDYFNQGGQPEPNHNQMLSYRVFNTGPFGNAQGTYTLTGAPSAGATSATLSSPWPSNNVNGYYNSTSTAASGTTSTTLIASAPSGGWPVNWAANYWVGSFLFTITHDVGATTQGCRVGSSTAVTAGSSGTMSVTCLTSSQNLHVGDTWALSQFSSERNVPYLATFSDGEQRVVQLDLTGTAFPNTTFGTNFATLTGCSTGTCTAAPLTCSPSCTSTVTIQALGDQYSSESDGPIGTAFIEPGSSSYLIVSIHLYGPQSGVPKQTECRSGASSSNLLPTAPDTKVYNQVQITAYDMHDILKQALGVPNPIYTATPYESWTLPGGQNLSFSADGCIYGGTQSGGTGFAAYDPVAGILYLSSMNNSTGNIVIYEYSVASM